MEALASSPRALFSRTASPTPSVAKWASSSATRPAAGRVRAAAAEPAGEEKPAAAAADGDAASAPAPKKILKKKPVYSMKKGQIVRVEKEKYLNSINYLSVGHPPFYKGLDYIYEDRGEVLDIRIFETGEYALIAWVGIPTPPAWLPTYMLIKFLFVVCASMEDASGGLATAASSSGMPHVEEKTLRVEEMALPADFPHLRLERREASVHGLESNKFSVEVHHGGYFMRSESSISYMDEKSTVWFDNLDRNTFNRDAFDNLIDMLGYEKRKFVFRCPPGKALDELVEVSLEYHCKLMAEASMKSKVLVVFVHHPDADEQEVKDELSHSESSENSEQEEDYPCDLDEDPSWHDSDYDMKEDDNLYAEMWMIPRHATPILPPLYKKCVGRRKKNRRKQPEESEDGTRLSRHGSIIHCGYCKKAGHNRGGCSQLKAAIIRENEVAQEEPTQQDNHDPSKDIVDPQQDNQGKGKDPAPLVDVKNTSSRGRKRTQSSKMREHVKNLMEIARKKKSKYSIDENDDIDFPIIKTHIHKQVMTYVDPEQQNDSLIHILSHEGAAQGILVIREEIPEESSFVAEHRANLPVARGPLVNTYGRSLRGTGSRGERGARGPRGPRGGVRARGARSAS